MDRYDISAPHGGMVNVTGPLKIKHADLVMQEGEGPAGLVIDALMLLDAVEHAECFDKAESGYFRLKDGREFSIAVECTQPFANLPEGAEALIAQYREGGITSEEIVIDLVLTGMSISPARRVQKYYQAEAEANAAKERKTDAV